MNEERKSLEQRAQMTDVERLRHSAAHVLATAILKIWPEAQFAAGPPVENGFYYDVDLSHRISPEDFAKIEAEMKKEIKANHPFERMEVSRDDALELGQKGRLAALSERNQPMITRVPSGYDANLKWTPVPGASAYRLFWREAWGPDWQHDLLVGNVTQAVLPNMQIDDYVFGVAAIDAEGHESLVAPYVSPPRQGGPVKTIP